MKRRSIFMNLCHLENKPELKILDSDFIEFKTIQLTDKELSERHKKAIKGWDWKIKAACEKEINKRVGRKINIESIEIKPSLFYKMWVEPYL